ncbi:MAG: NUDIX domain-containing protein [Rickettsiales bacterium]|jgi:8-oxo-dGTP pyrophosphatase MutT (NUDIX family)|nr:NUDIX domain-containing protein [Rickettsiales bacterium]
MIPIIEADNENRVMPGVETIERDTILAVVKHPTEDKYLYLKYKKLPWNVLIQGGIEGGENPMISALRECIEETGFYEIRSIQKLPLDFDNVFYAAHKNVNRYSRVKTYFIELASLAQKPHEDEFDILFDTYENMQDIFGPAFAHHYFLLGVAIGKQSIDDLDYNSSTYLGKLKLDGLKVSYRQEN